MSTSGEMTKATIIGQAHQPSPPTDPDLDRMLQAILVEDPEQKLLIKGEINEALNLLRAHNGEVGMYITRIKDVLVSSLRDKLITSVEAGELIAVFGQIEKRFAEQQPLMEKIYAKLSHYLKMVPYLLVLSPMTRLGNLTQPMADSLKRKFSIMIGRDKLMSSGGDDSYEDANFWDSLEITGYMCIQDAVGGWKMQGVVTEKRQVSTIIEDRSVQQRKKRLGLF